MKTTIDIADHLLQEAKKKAHEQNRTLRDLVEEGLRRVLAEDSSRPRFKLKDGAFKGGKGLQPGMREGDWDQVRDMIYGFEDSPPVERSR